MAYETFRQICGDFLKKHCLRERDKAISLSLFQYIAQKRPRKPIDEFRHFHDRFIQKVFKHALETILGSRILERSGKNVKFS